MAAPFDSGYTQPELELLFDQLAAGAVFTWPDEALALALAIGLSDGDVVELSERGTVILTTRRADLDRRVAAIRAELAAGLCLSEAVGVIVAANRVPAEQTPEREERGARTAEKRARQAPAAPAAPAAPPVIPATVGEVLLSWALRAGRTRVAS